MGWLTSVSGVSSSCGISMAYIFMEEISESLVAEGLFFNKKWVRWSALILINQLWQMVILPFKRGLEKLNSRWFKNSLRAAEPNLKEKQKAEQNTLKLALFALAWVSLTLGRQHHSQGYTGTFPPKSSVQGAMGLPQEMCLLVPASSNPHNGNSLLSQEIMLLRHFGVGGGNYYTFHRGFVPWILKNLCCIFLKGICGAWVDEEQLRHSHCDSQSIDWCWGLKGSQFARAKPALFTWFHTNSLWAATACPSSNCIIIK